VQSVPRNPKAVQTPLPVQISNIHLSLQLIESAHERFDRLKLERKQRIAAADLLRGQV